MGTKTALINATSADDIPVVKKGSPNMGTKTIIEKSGRLERNLL